MSVSRGEASRRCWIPRPQGKPRPQLVPLKSDWLRSCCLKIGYSWAPPIPLAYHHFSYMDIWYGISLYIHAQVRSKHVSKSDLFQDFSQETLALSFQILVFQDITRITECLGMSRGSAARPARLRWGMAGMASELAHHAEQFRQDSTKIYQVPLGNSTGCYGKSPYLYTLSSIKGPCSSLFHV